MPRYQGARLSAQLTGHKVRVVCIRCKLHRQYDGTALVSRVGPSVSLPDLLTRIAVGIGCDLNISPTPNGIRCALHYEELGAVREERR